MKKGTSFPEIMISLLIVSVGLFTFLKMTSDYVRTLVFSKEMFILNSALQEKYQLLIAYRNKFLEQGFNQQFDLPSSFCLEFNSRTNKIDIIVTSTPCEFKFLNQKSHNIKYIVKANTSTNLFSIDISASTTKPFGLKVNLKGFLTTWHPVFQ